MPAIAEIMASYHVHAVVVSASASASFIGPTEPLRRAAELMSEHGVSHLVVSTAPAARPVGIILSMDLAVLLASGRG